jgi:hypothetical protein
MASNIAVESRGRVMKAKICTCIDRLLPASPWRAHKGQLKAIAVDGISLLSFFPLLSLYKSGKNAHNVIVIEDVAGCKEVQIPSPSRWICTLASCHLV